MVLTLLSRQTMGQNEIDSIQIMPERVSEVSDEINVEKGVLMFEFEEEKPMKKESRWTAFKKKIYDGEKKTFLTKNKVTWLSIFMGSIVILVVIGIVFHIRLESKKMATEKLERRERQAAAAAAAAVLANQTVTSRKLMNVDEPEYLDVHTGLFNEHDDLFLKDIPFRVPEFPAKIYQKLPKKEGNHDNESIGQLKHIEDQKVLDQQNAVPMKEVNRGEGTIRQLMSVEGQEVDNEWMHDFGDDYQPIESHFFFRIITNALHRFKDLLNLENNLILITEDIKTENTSTNNETSFQIVYQKQIGEVAATEIAGKQIDDLEAHEEISNEPPAVFQDKVENSGFQPTNYGNLEQGDERDNGGLGYNVEENEIARNDDNPGFIGDINNELYPNYYDDNKSIRPVYIPEPTEKYDPYRPLIRKKRI